MRIKNVIVIFLIGFIIGFIASCKKGKKETETPPPQIALVKQTISSGNTVSLYEEYVYDNEKRLSEIKQSQVNSTIVSRKYFYTGSQVLFRYYNNGAEQVAGSVNYILNDAGLIQEDYQLGSGYRITKEYNEAGYVKKEIYIRNGITEGYTAYSYSGNNVLDSISFCEQNNNKAYVRIFSYHAGKTNTIGNENKGLRMFGKDQRQALQKETFITYNFPGYAGQRIRFFENSYNYTYDNIDRIKSSLITRTDYPPVGNPSTYTFAAYEYIYQ